MAGGSVGRRRTGWPWWPWALAVLGGLVVLVGLVLAVHTRPISDPYRL